MEARHYAFSLMTFHKKSIFTGSLSTVSRLAHPFQVDSKFFQSIAHVYILRLVKSFTDITFHEKVEKIFKAFAHFGLCCYWHDFVRSLCVHVCLPGKDSLMQLCLEVAWSCVWCKSGWAILLLSRCKPAFFNPVVQCLTVRRKCVQGLWRELYSNPSCKLHMAVHFCTAQLFSDRQLMGTLCTENVSYSCQSFNLKAVCWCVFSRKTWSACAACEPMPNQLWAARVLIGYCLRHCRSSMLVLCFRHVFLNETW